ncbi:MAG TPA: hypothetical protein DCG49_11540 [Ruminococcus sp.]|nr:hypothetical protein [Ruminococcus sp.]
MNKSKNIIKISVLISGVCTIICGIWFLVAGMMDISVPKPVTILFCIGCLVSGIVNIRNAVRGRNEK